MTAAQRRADALGLLAETALSADLDRGTAGDRYQVMLHIDSATGVAAGELVDVPAMGRLSGTLEVDHVAVDVSAETSRRVSCDASLVTMRQSIDGAVLDIGRKTRTIPPSIRRALFARDRTCRFPGCTSRRCDAHHVEHWIDGGATSLDNLMLLCRRHHRAVHEGGFGLLPALTTFRSGTARRSTSSTRSTCYIHNHAPAGVACETAPLGRIQLDDGPRVHRQMATGRAERALGFA